MTESAINWDVEFDSTPDMLPSNPAQDAAIEFARKRSGGIGASQISQILTYRTDYSKIPELQAAIAELTAKIKNSTTGKTVTAEKDLATKKRQLDAILNDTLPAGAKELAKRVALERITGFCEESDVSFESPATRWGNKYEAEAIEVIKERYPDVDFLFTGEEQKSFRLDNYEHFWATPDAVVSIGGYVATLDVKCPFKRENHHDNLHLTDWDSFMSLHIDYAYQGVCQMLAAGVTQFWFASYDPRFPAPHNLIVHQFELNQDDAKFLRSRVEMFESEVKRVMSEYE